LNEFSLLWYRAIIMSLFLLCSIPLSFGIVWNQFNKGHLNEKESRSKFVYSLLALAFFGLCFFITSSWFKFDYLPGQAFLFQWWYDHFLVVLSIIIPGIFIFRKHHQEERIRLYLSIFAYGTGTLTIMNLIHLLSNASYLSFRDLFSLPLIYILYLFIVPFWLILIIHPRRLFLILGIVLFLSGTVLLSILDLVSILRDAWAMVILFIVLVPMVFLISYVAYQQLYDPNYLKNIRLSFLRRNKT
jgi:hypothetical protein